MARHGLTSVWARHFLTAPSKESACIQFGMSRCDCFDAGFSSPSVSGASYTDPVAMPVSRIGVIGLTAAPALTFGNEDPAERRFGHTRHGNSWEIFGPGGTSPLGIPSKGLARLAT